MQLHGHGLSAAQRGWRTLSALSFFVLAFGCSKDKAAPPVAQAAPPKAATGAGPVCASGSVNQHPEGTTAHHLDDWA